MHKIDSYSRWAGIFCLIVTFWFAMNYTSRNMGGSGVQVPYNTFAWLAASLFILVAVTRSLFLRKFYLHTTTKYYAGALVCLFFPLAYTDRLFLDVELLRIIGTFAGVLFFVSLQQFVGGSFSQILLWILLVSTSLQTVWGFVQYYFIFEPSRLFWSAASGSPYGVFQQVNVYSIYLALGSMLGLCLFSKLDARKRKSFAVLGVAALIFLNAHLTVLSEAATARFVGFLSVFVYVAYLLSRCLISKKHGVFFAFILIVGTFVPKSLFDVRPHFETKGASSHLQEAASAYTSEGLPSGTSPTSSESYRGDTFDFGTRPTIYAVSLDMFMDKPVTGHGIGTFRKQYLLYQGEYLRKNKDAPAEFNLSHPHNEVLYWMVEMGALPALGFLMILLGWICGVRSESLDLSILLVALPLVIQSLVELPFYHSVAHYLGFILILVAAMNGRFTRTIFIPSWSSLLVLPLVLWSTWKAWLFLLSTFYALSMFLLFNASGRNNIDFLLEVNNPSAFRLRYEFEIFQWQLRKAEADDAISLDHLNAYLKWAFSTVQYAPLQTTYENFVGLLILIDNKGPARRYLSEGLLMYPNSEALQKFEMQLRDLGATSE